MSNARVRFGIPADEQRVFTLLTALMEGELVAGSPIEQFSTARATFQDLLTSDRGSVIVFELDGEVLGVVTCSYVTAIRYGGNYARMEELVVDERARGTGAGKMLVSAAIAEARRRGCELITLYAREHTRAFYEKAGFRYIGPELHRATD
jgi:ribosomal protein S18 acetylase RimI-like enzyme